MIKEETKQTAEEAARGYSNDCRNRQRHCEPYCIVDFISGAQWQSKQSPWISVKERLPEEGQRVLVGFLWGLWKCDRYSEYSKYIDVFTYEDGWWIDDSYNVYRGKDVTGDDIKVICWQPIPSFDEILEANRDVLERIKEKGG